MPEENARAAPGSSSSPTIRPILRLFLVVLVTVFIAGSALGVWGMVQVQRLLLMVTDQQLASIQHMADARVTIFLAQNDTRQALLEANTNNVEFQLAYLRTHVDDAQIAIDALLASQPPPTIAAALPELADMFGTWKAYQNRFISDIERRDDAGLAAALRLQTGPLHTQTASLLNKLAQIDARARAAVQRAAADASQTTKTLVYLVSSAIGLGIAGVISLSIYATRQIGRLHDRVLVMNTSLSDALAEQQAQSEEILAQQEQLRLINAEVTEATIEVTRQRDMQRALLQSIAPDIFIACDEHYRIVECNAAAESLLGTSEKTCIGRNLLEWEELAQRDAFTLARAQGRHLYQTTISGIDATRHIEVHLSWNEAIQTYIGVARDVSERVKIERELAKLYQEANQLALYDPLTELRNHRALQQCLQQELARAKSAGQPISVVMLDVDHFRRFNETYGHDVGDRALRVVANAIQAAIRDDDLPARYGGEEFTIILPQTDLVEACLIAERIREQITVSRVTARGLPDGIPITASLGVATFPTHASVPAALVKAADIALYAAKHAGRNRVEAFHLNLVEVVDERESLSLLPDATLATIQQQITGIDLRDSYTAAHSEGVAHYAVMIAQRLGLDDSAIERLRIGALIHDVGKITIPTAILRKTGALTADEIAIFRTHAAAGAAILGAIPAFQDLLPLVRSHHERLDGSGYPDRLRGAQIPLAVRILSVADVFEAYTSERPYHQSRSLAEGIALLQSEAAAGRLDQRVVAALRESITSTDLITAFPSLAA